MNLIMNTDQICFSLSFKLKSYLPHNLASRKGLHTLPVVPAVVYSNFDVDKKRVVKENKGKSGIYRWTNNITGASYVGSSVDLAKRLSQYFSTVYLNKELTNGKSKIYSALLKYGYSSFILEILEYCDRIDVIKREQYYIDLLKPEYNLDPTAGSRLGSLHDEEARAKMRAAHVGRELSVSQKEHLAKLIATNVGRKHEEATKIKQSVAALGREVSVETRAKLVAASTTALKIKVIDMVTGESTIYASARRAAEVIGCNHKLILARIHANYQKLIQGRFLIFRES